MGGTLCKRHHANRRRRGFEVSRAADAKIARPAYDGARDGF
jgi:hypothetical protein